MSNEMLTTEQVTPTPQPAISYLWVDAYNLKTVDLSGQGQASQPDLFGGDLPPFFFVGKDTTSPYMFYRLDQPLYCYLRSIVKAQEALVARGGLSERVYKLTLTRFVRGAHKVAQQLWGLDKLKEAALSFAVKGYMLPPMVNGQEWGEKLKAWGVAIVDPAAPQGVSEVKPEALAVKVEQSSVLGAEAIARAGDALTAQVVANIDSSGVSYPLLRLPDPKTFNAEGKVYQVAPVLPGGKCYQEDPPHEVKRQPPEMMRFEPDRAEPIAPKGEGWGPMLAFTGQQSAWVEVGQQTPPPKDQPTTPTNMINQVVEPTSKAESSSAVKEATPKKTKGVKTKAEGEGVKGWTRSGGPQWAGEGVVMRLQVSAGLGSSQAPQGQVAQVLSPHIPKVNFEPITVKDDDALPGDPFDKAARLKVLQAALSEVSNNYHPHCLPWLRLEAKDTYKTIINAELVLEREVIRGTPLSAKKAADDYVNTCLRAFALWFNAHQQERCDRCGLEGAGITKPNPKDTKQRLCPWCLVIVQDGASGYTALVAASRQVVTGDPTHDQQRKQRSSEEG